MILSVEDLQSFEKEIEHIYSTGKIKAPIHLRNGNEQYLIDIFKDIKQEDYVFSTWASHLHAILKGVPREMVKNHILKGRSITLTFPEHNFFTSAIVGGAVPFAVGVAYDIKQQNSSQHVYVFVGDMAAMTGIFHESLRYSEGWDLPITFIIEDNEKSVGTPTKAAWGSVSSKILYEGHPLVKYYQYKLGYPHAGIGKFVEF